MFCEKCGKHLEEGSIFCNVCGAKQPQPVFCPQCGKRLEPRSRFCNICGVSQIAPQIQPVQAQPVQEMPAPAEPKTVLPEAPKLPQRQEMPEAVQQTPALPQPPEDVPEAPAEVTVPETVREVPAEVTVPEKPSVAEIPAKKPKSKKWLIPVVALAAALAVVAVVAVLLLPGSKPKPKPTAEETVTLYLLTGRTEWLDGEKTSQTIVEYDDLGRPTLFSLDGHWVMDCSLTYDRYGNRIEESFTRTESFQNDRGESDEKQFTSGQAYDFDYDSRGHIRSCTVYSANGAQREKLLTLEFTCDAQGRITLVEYGPEAAYSSNVWDHYVYDKQGRLVQETFCRADDLSAMPGSQIPERIYDSYLTRYCYTYDKNGDLDSISRSGVRVTGPEIVAYNEVKDAEFVVAEEHSVDIRNGHIIIDGNDSMLDNKGNPSDPGDVFDSQGNLIRSEGTYATKKDGVLIEQQQVTEYTYKKVELPLSDAQKAQRMMEMCGLPSNISNYAIFFFGDAALDLRTRPILLHSVFGYTRCYYYLIPNPVC